MVSTKVFKNKLRQKYPNSRFTRLEAKHRIGLCLVRHETAQTYFSGSQVYQLDLALRCKITTGRLVINFTNSYYFYIRTLPFSYVFQSSLILIRSHTYSEWSTMQQMGGNFEINNCCLQLQFP
jgi:hypothetical protein